MTADENGTPDAGVTGGESASSGLARRFSALAFSLVSSIGPLMVCSVPGAFIMVWYQCHIGLFPAFIGHASLWAMLAVSVVSVVLYALLLMYGMVAGFWLYALPVLFRRQWWHIHETPEEPPAGRASGGFWRALRSGGAWRAWVRSAVSLAVILGFVVLMTVENAALHHMALPHFGVAARAPARTQAEGLSGVIPAVLTILTQSRLLAVFIGNLLACWVATLIWKQLAGLAPGGPAWSLRDCVPVMRRQKRLYWYAALVIVVLLSIVTRVLVELAPFWGLLSGAVGSALFPVCLWWGSSLMLPRALPPVQPVHNVVSLKGVELFCWICISLFMLFFFMLIGALNGDDQSSVELLVYFGFCGFITLWIVDAFPWRRRRQAAALLLIPASVWFVMLVLLPGVGPRMARQFISVLNFRTSGQEQVFVTDEVSDRITGLLDAYRTPGPEVCTTSVGGRSFRSVSVRVNGVRMPLVVLWNDGSDKKVIGFDREMARPVPFDFPAVSVDAASVIELPWRWVAACDETAFPTGPEAPEGDKRPM